MIPGNAPACGRSTPGAHGARVPAPPRPRWPRWARPSALLTVLLLIGAPAQTQAAEDFLKPEDAFRVSGRADGPDAVRVRWEIADGYYLYQRKLRFQTDPGGSGIGEPELPPPTEIKQDPSFGDVPIYRDGVDVRLPVTRTAGSGAELVLEATSQGCADAGLCYPPQRQTLRLKLPALEPAAADSPGTAQPAAALPGAADRTASRLGQSLGLDAVDDIPPVEDAFRFQAAVAAPDRLQLSWEIAPDTYLYRSLVTLTLENAGDVALGNVHLPAGETKKDSVLPDGTLGDAEVYLGGIDLAVPLSRGSASPTEITLVAKYQGCAERGICYPPQTQRIRLSLPALPGSTAASPAAVSAQPESSMTPAIDPPAAAALAPSEQDRIAAVLAGGKLWAIAAAFFGFGLLLAFTPCVFPMIPILSGIIVGHGHSITARKGFALSLVYVLAMALTYTAAGVLAGLFGANLQAVFQNPWILSAFALVFVLLALSMFGFYDLQLPSSLQSRIAAISNRQSGGSLIGVGIMGLLSALIVGPCVAPPLFGALIYISQTGDALLGGFALFAFSLGMGAPLIAIGASAGRLLPRAGAWMDAIKAVFGVALLGVAILLLERILPPAAAMALWGLLLICSAVYLGVLTHLPPDSSGWRKLWKGVGAFLLVYGTLMLMGAAAGGKDTLQPLRGVILTSGSAELEPTAFQRIKTTADLDHALARAKAAGRPVMLDFYADWCVSCKEMERDTFSDPAAIAQMRRFSLLQADVTANDDADRTLMQDRFGIPGPPAILFFDSDGREVDRSRLIGFKPAAEFAAHLQEIAR